MRPRPTQAERARRVPANVLVAIAATAAVIGAAGWIATPRADDGPVGVVSASLTSPVTSTVAVPGSSDLTAVMPTGPTPTAAVTTDPVPTDADPVSADPADPVPADPGPVAPPSGSVPPPSDRPADAADPASGCEEASTGVTTEDETPHFLTAEAEGELRSLESTTCTSVRLVNIRADGEPVTLYWLDFEGSRVDYGTVEAGGEIVLQTYLTHPWVITRMDDTALLVLLPGTRSGTVNLR